MLILAFFPFLLRQKKLTIQSRLNMFGPVVDTVVGEAVPGISDTADGPSDKVDFDFSNDGVFFCLFFFPTTETNVCCDSICNEPAPSSGEDGEEVDAAVGEVKSSREDVFFLAMTPLLFVVDVDDDDHFNASD